MTVFLDAAVLRSPRKCDDCHWLRSSFLKPTGWGVRSKVCMVYPLPRMRQPPISPYPPDIGWWQFNPFHFGEKYDCHKKTDKWLDLLTHWNIGSCSICKQQEYWSEKHPWTLLAIPNTHHNANSWSIRTTPIRLPHDFSKTDNNINKHTANQPKIII